MSSGATASRPNRFITLEGGEGAGKSTHARRLAARIEAAGETVLVTREPGGAPGAEQIRGLLVEGAPDRWQPMSEALLHFAARREHVSRTIEPALAAGNWVVCDRFADSTMAYQGYGQGLGREAIEVLYRLVLGDFAPALTVILDLPVADGLVRAAGRAPGSGISEDRYERMDGGFHQRMRDGFLEIARRDSERCIVVDATATPDTVHEAVCAAVHERLGLAL